METIQPQHQQQYIQQQHKEDNIQPQHHHHQQILICLSYSQQTKGNVDLNQIIELLLDIAPSSRITSPPPQRGLGAMPSRARQAHRANAMQCNSHRHTGRPRIAAAVHSTADVSAAVSCTVHEVMRAPLSCTLQHS